MIDDNGPSAIASYGEVFASYTGAEDDAAGQGGAGATDNSGDTSGGTGAGSGAETNFSSVGAAGNQGNGTGNAGEAGTGNPLKANALFAYSVKRHDLTLAQLMKEAKGLNTKTYPAAGSALLRSIIEVILKLIVDEKSLNSMGKLLDLEGALNVVIGKGSLSQDDVKVLQEFKKTYLSYMNLSAHATVVPNHTRLMMARDCIDAFIKRNV